MTEYQRATLKEFIKENAGRRLRMVIEEMTPESRNQRKFYHGAVIPLWAYLDGKDYKDGLVLDQLHEIAKREFNGEVIMVAGKAQLVGKSTKGLLAKGFLERVIDYLVENYGIDPAKVLNVDLYKKFRDEIYGFSQYDTFIDFMVAQKII